MPVDGECCPIDTEDLLADSAILAEYISGLSADELSTFKENHFTGYYTYYYNGV